MYGNFRLANWNESEKFMIDLSAWHVVNLKIKMRSFDRSPPRLLSPHAKIAYFFFGFRSCSRTKMGQSEFAISDRQRKHSETQCNSISFTFQNIEWQPKCQCNPKIIEKMHSILLLIGLNLRSSEAISQNMRWSLPWIETEICFSFRARRSWLNRKQQFGREKFWRKTNKNNNKKNVSISTKRRLSSNGDDKKKYSSEETISQTLRKRRVTRR